MPSIPRTIKTYPEFLLRIHAAKNGSWEGTLYTVHTGQRQEFLSVLELINLLAAVVEEPSGSGPLRSWEEEAGSLESQSASFLQALQTIKASLDSIQEEDRPLNPPPQEDQGTTSFIVRVMFRQHASWQGEIEWPGKPEEPRTWFFRSLLELLCLMQEALERESQGKDDQGLCSLDDA